MREGAWLIAFQAEQLGSKKQAKALLAGESGGGDGSRGRARVCREKRGG
jgi:hypothetical protein